MKAVGSEHELEASEASPLRPKGLLKSLGKSERHGRSFVMCRRNVMRKGPKQA